MSAYANILCFFFSFIYTPWQFGEALTQINDYKMYLLMIAQVFYNQS